MAGDGFEGWVIAQKGHFGEYQELNKNVEAQKYMMCVGDGGKFCEDLSPCEISSPYISHYKLGLLHYNQWKARTSLSHQIKLLQIRFCYRKEILVAWEEEAGEEKSCQETLWERELGPDSGSWHAVI